MGWLKKIFKGSSHKISEQHSHDGYGEDTVENEPSSSWNLQSENEDEDEDLDHAIALSLAEEEKGKRVIDDEFQLEEDEQFARALQESLNVKSPPRSGIGNGSGSGIGIGNGSGSGIGNGSGIGSGNNYQPIPFPYTRFRTCAGCNNEIGHGRFLSCIGAFWHPECFRCHGCGYPILDHEFSMSGNYPYHKSCYKEQYHPKCDVCRDYIPTNHAGLIEYRAHPYWDQKYCPSHEYDRTPRCCSCERMEPRDTSYVAIGDGRKLCLECLNSAIMDTNECQPLYHDIQEYYEGLNMKLRQQVPLLLVERQALNEAIEGEKRVRPDAIKIFHTSSVIYCLSQQQGHHNMPETRGLCLSEEQTVTSILRRPKIVKGNQITDLIREPRKLERRCEVTAVLILYGLPRLLTGTILAHEMMHAWLRLNGYRGLALPVEEGICQVLAHMWLDAEITSLCGSNFASTSSSSSFSKQAAESQCERNLGLFFKHQLENDPSEIYGGGFRAGHQAVLKYGLPATLKHIQMTGIFPC